MFNPLGILSSSFSSYFTYRLSAISETETLVTTSWAAHLIERNQHSKSNKVDFTTHDLLTGVASLFYDGVAKVFFVFLMFFGCLAFTGLWLLYANRVEFSSCCGLCIRRLNGNRSLTLYWTRFSFFLVFWSKKKTTGWILAASGGQNIFRGFFSFLKRRRRKVHWRWTSSSPVGCGMITTGG